MNSTTITTPRWRVDLHGIRPGEEIWGAQHQRSAATVARP
jgi:hypothetical protein